MLGLIFLWLAFLSIDAVGSELWTSLHEYIDCDTHRRAPNNSSIKLLNVRVLDYAVGRLFNDDKPPGRSNLSWSLPLALELGEHFMSTSMVNLPGASSITRPTSRARRWRGVGGTVFIAFRSSEINLIEIKNYQYQNAYYLFKIKTLIV